MEPCSKCSQNPCTCMIYISAKAPRRPMPPGRFMVRDSEGFEILTIKVDGSIHVGEGVAAQHLAEVLCELFVFPKLNEMDRGGF